MRTTPIYLDRLDHSLKGHGITLKRAQLLETASYAFGFHNSSEFSAAAKAGALAAPKAEPISRIEVGDETLIILRDPIAGSFYAVDEDFLGQVACEERRELYGNSPYGHLLDVGDVADHPITARDGGKAQPEAKASGKRFAVLDESLDILSRHDDEDAAKNSCPMTTHETHYTCDEAIVDVVGGRALHYDWGWREEAIQGRDEGEMLTAGRLAITKARLERLKTRHDQTLRLDVPDWRAWDKDLKKASHARQEPVSDEILHQFRHAIADAGTSKSSTSERSEVDFRRTRYAEKHLGGLIARLDRAEDALREAGLAPSEIARKSKDDAAETLAAIEAVAARRKDLVIPNLYEVDATRDGDRCREIFLVQDGEDPEDAGRRIAAREFRMNLEEYRFPEDEDVDKDGNPVPDYSPFDSECDTFDVLPVHLPESAAIIGDALLVLSSASFQYGMPHDHPARIKLLAAVDRLRPKPTV